MARTEGKRQAPRERRVTPPPSAKKKPKLPTVDTPAEESRFNPKVVFGALGGIVVLALIVAVAIGTATEQSPADDLPTDFTVELDGNALVPLAPSGADPAIGQPIPEVVSTVDFDGNPTSITIDGTPKVILFLAHWCQFCQREVPNVQAYVDETGLPSGVDFVSVVTSIDRARPNYPPNAWLEEEGWTQRIVMDDPRSSIATAYGLPAFPYYVFVDGDGNVVSRITGEQDPTTIALAMEALAAGN
jgi:thiol-disulfide isomerase/thioredoxin